METGELDRLLAELKGEGTTEAEALGFTIDLTAARRSIARVVGPMAERWPVFVVSAALRAGAQSVDFHSRPAGLSVLLPGAYLELERFVDSRHRLLLGDVNSGALDLLMGCQLALARGALSVAVQSSRVGAGGFRWKLDPDRDQFIELPPGEADESRIEIEFGGAVQEPIGPAELKVLKRDCQYSLTPITLDGRSLTRAFFLPQNMLSIQVGQLPSGAVSFPRGPIRRVPRSPSKGSSRPLGLQWSAALGLQRGKVQVVQDGVSLGELRRTGLDGIVYCSGLRRDMALLSTVRDHRYDALWTDLRRLGLSLQREFLQS